MSYTLKYYGNSTSSFAITVPDGEANTIGEITFPGRNFAGYGSPVDQNFLNLTENFARFNNGPGNPVRGQIWFDSANTKLKYNVANNNSDGTTNTGEWQAVLFSKGSGSNTVVELATEGKVTIGNTAAASANATLNRTISLSAGTDGNLNSTGNISLLANPGLTDSATLNGYANSIGNGVNAANFISFITSYYSNSMPVYNISSDTGNVATQGAFKIGLTNSTSANLSNPADNSSAIANLTLLPSGNINTVGTYISTTGNVAQAVPGANFAYSNLSPSGILTLNSNATSNTSVAGGTITTHAANGETAVINGGNLTTTSAVSLVTGANTTNGYTLVVGPSGHTGPIATFNGDIIVSGNYTVNGTYTAINSTILTELDPIIDQGAEAYNSPLTGSSLGPRGIALHTWGTGKRFTTTATASIGATTVNANSTTGITVGMRIGSPDVQAFDPDAKVLSFTSTSITFDKALTSAVASGANIGVGDDNVHFMGWDAANATFVFTSGTNQLIDNNTISSYATAPVKADSANLTTTLTVGTSATVGTTLGVTGATTLSSTLSVAGLITSTSGISGGPATHTTGSFSSTLDVTGATTLSSTLGVTGAATLSNTLGVAGATTLSSTLGVTGAATLNSTLSVASLITSTGGISGGPASHTTGTFSGQLSVTDTTDSTSSGTGSIHTSGGLGVSKDAYIGGALHTTNITTGASGTAGSITGAWSLTGTFEATYADLAERHHADDNYPTGTVMTVGGVNEITASDSESRVLGVVSDAYAYLMNGEAGPQETHPAVAYVGRVPVRVIGPIKKHDIVSVAANGVAQASRSNGFGWAIESNDEPGEKLVLCIIK